MKTHRRKRARYVLRKQRPKHRRHKHRKSRPPTYSARPGVPLRPHPNPPAGTSPSTSTSSGSSPGHTPTQVRFGHAEAERLLWRAGFGPRPGDVDRVAALGLDGAVAELLRPPTAQLTGPAPHDEDGNPLAPEDIWGDAHCWWLDRMVRSNQPLVERMTLVWHDWFATSNDKVGSWRMMLDQNALFRIHALGSFRDLLVDVTKDPAMLVWLDGIDNSRRDPNENYAREVMELFTLGADRGAYSEDDVRELARAFTGWRATWSQEQGLHDFRFDPTRHDAGAKTVLGKTGAFDWQDACGLCVESQFHASFFVTKLWSYFIPTPPDAATQAALQALYVGHGYSVAPVLEAILKHPDLYGGQAMVKPPVVYSAGLLRATGQFITSNSWGWLDAGAGQFLFLPPNVSGWDDTRWLDTSSWRGRWMIVAWITRDWHVDPWDTAHPYDPLEDPPTAVSRALDALGSPGLTSETRAALLAFAQTSLPTVQASWQRSPLRGQRQNALRMLIMTCADYHTS